MDTKEKFVIEFTPLEASKFQKNGQQLNRSWADHVLGKVIKQLIPVLSSSIEHNRKAGNQSMATKTPRDEAIACVDMLLARHRELIKAGVYTHNLTCSDQRAMRRI